MKKVTKEPQYKEFICKDCSENTLFMNEYYMVTDEVWNQASAVPNSKGSTSHRGMLCIGCLESRIQRTLTKADFPDYPINSLDMFYKSERLLNRLTA